MTSEHDKLAKTRWTTKDEKKFIDGMGFDKDHVPTNRPPSCQHFFALTREEMLQKYIETSRARVNWGEIDRDAVVKYAEEALR